jgi:hypothetical protein
MKNLAWVYWKGLGVAKDIDKYHFWTNAQNNQYDLGTSDNRFGVMDDYRVHQFPEGERKKDASTYRFARNIFNERGFKTAIDLSGSDSYAEYFSEAEVSLKPELVISANIIEYERDPEKYLLVVKRTYPGAILVLSTPNRGDLSLYSLSQFRGPPFEKGRYREWSLVEFHEWTNRLLGETDIPLRLRGTLINMVKVIQL